MTRPRRHTALATATAVMLGCPAGSRVAALQVSEEESSAGLVNDATGLEVHFHAPGLVEIA